MESLFSKIYSYRERENKNSKENFLIEIFAHCLLMDKNFFRAFLELLKLDYEEDFSIKTQSIYEYGRPDIELNLHKSNTCILIECKIEHYERINQLEDYKKILLEKNVRKRHLVYLTKYYEYRENENKYIDFSLVRWSDIYSLISENNNQITQELKLYLKNENMSESKNFNYNDIITLLKITDTLSKMDEVIDSIKDYFEKKIGGLSKKSSRSTRLNDNWYVAYHQVGEPKFKFSIDIGFWWWNNEEVSVGIRIWIPKAEKYPETEKIKDFFEKNLKDWDFNVWNNAYTFEISEYVAKFIIEDEEQFSEIRDFLKANIDELVEIKKLNPNIFK